MAVSEHDQTRIRDYLLGQLQDEELVKIEERLMIEDDLQEELEISKGELIEEYCAGELNRQEHSWFGSRYLATKEGREHHVLTLALECLQRPAPAPKKLTLGERIKSLFKNPPWALATASLALVVVIGALFFIRQPRGVYAVTLSNTTLTRDNENNSPLPQIVTLPPNTAELRASLKLPKALPSATRFEAVLDNRIDRKPVDVVEQHPDVVTVSIPARELPKGEYALELTAINSDGNKEEIPGNYRFSVR